MYATFVVICIVHVVFWLFVLFAFYTKQTARINLYYIIPAVYILHILPFHLLNNLKASIYPNNWKDKTDEVLNSIPIVRQFTNLQKTLDKYCFANPVGAQGMLLFGAITSAYALR